MEIGRSGRSRESEHQVSSEGLNFKMSAEKLEHLRGNAKGKRSQKRFWPGDFPLQRIFQTRSSFQDLEERKEYTFPRQNEHL